MTRPCITCVTTATGTSSRTWLSYSISHKARDTTIAGAATNISTTGTTSTTITTRNTTTAGCVTRCADRSFPSCAFHCLFLSALKVYNSEPGLHEHRRIVHADEYCVPCKRMFRDNNALRHHERSTFHQGRKVGCPMKGCNKSFVSRAALVHHLESGGCPSRINRDMVNRIVAKLDKSGVITDSSRLIGGGQEAVTGGWATARAWNGERYECYLCHRTFAALLDLNQHLNSPAHAQKAYRCPGAWRGCGATFKTLSGFCQHVESEQCGVCRFKTEMERFIDGLSKGRKLLL